MTYICRAMRKCRRQECARGVRALRIYRGEGKCSAYTEMKKVGWG